MSEKAILLPAEVMPPAPVVQTATALVPANMDDAIKLAQMMAKGKLVPQHLQDSPADCLMVIEQAARWRMSPFAVAQSTSSIRGKLMFEGKLVAAAVHNSGVLARRLSYEFNGDKNERTVTVRGQIRGENEYREVTVALRDAQTDNGCWKKQPDQQLVYAGTRVWARRHVPEVMLGVYTPEEDFEDDTPPPETRRIQAPRSKSKTPPEGADASSPATDERPQTSAAPEPRAGVAESQRAEESPPAPAGQINLIRKKAEMAGVAETELCAKFEIGSLDSITVAQGNAMLKHLANG